VPQGAEAGQELAGQEPVFKAHSAGGAYLGATMSVSARET